MASTGRIPRIGINLPVDPRPEAIRSSLRRFADCGYECVEVGLDTVPLIVRGEAKAEYVEALRRILKELPLGYSAHIGSGVDLRDRQDPELHERVAMASVEVSSSLGASPLVLHFEEQSKDLEIEGRFLDAHRRLASRARSLGVSLCVENIEVERVQPVVRFISEVASPALSMAFDTGHAFLASRYFHFDFLESLRQALPLITHVHLSDNTGDFEPLRITNRVVYDALPKGYRFAFGRGDVHLPPYWGDIPLDAVFSATRGFEGIYVCECYSEYFHPFLSQVRERVSAAIARARS